MTHRHVFDLHDTSNHRTSTFLFPSPGGAVESKNEYSTVDEAAFAHGL
jgi:hypothetical protein